MAFLSLWRSLVRFHPNAFFPPLNMVFSSIILFKFQAIQKFYDLMNLCYGVFCKFFGDFGVCLRGNGFS